MKTLHFINYLLFRLFGFLVSLLAHPLLYTLGKKIGWLLYHVHREFRKKSHTNLAIAFPHLSFKMAKAIAIQSFQNLAITCLEFFWLKDHKEQLENLVDIVGSEEIRERLHKRQPIVFMTAHLANWEIPFLIASAHGSGVGIGRPIKNRWIYNYVLSVRQMHESRIIMPKNAIRAGLAALNEGKFVGIVGDQAAPKSNYSYPLFGMRAYTSTMPALLAYRTNSPLVVAFTQREKRRYRLVSTYVIWPNRDCAVKEEVERMMDLAMGYLQKRIEERPADWLWQHDRFKQPNTDHLKRAYRFTFVLILLPPHHSHCRDLVQLIRTLYPSSFLTFLAPRTFSTPPSDPAISWRYFDKESDLLIEDHRFQLVIDLYNSKFALRYYKKLSVIKTLNMKKVSSQYELIEQIAYTLCKSKDYACQITASFAKKSGILTEATV